MLHAIVGHTYTKYTHKMHKYTDAQIHELYTQIHKVNALKTKDFASWQGENAESATKWKGGREMKKKRKAKKLGHYVLPGVLRYDMSYLFKLDNTKQF